MQKMQHDGWPANSARGTALERVVSHMAQKTLEGHGDMWQAALSDLRQQETRGEKRPSPGGSPRTPGPPDPKRHMGSERTGSAASA